MSQIRVLIRKPELKSLSQGARITYVRKLRGMSQEKLGLAIGMSNDQIRKRICRYEKDVRVPRPERLTEIANVLNVNEEMIKVYDFIKPSDIVYQLFWLEEMCPETFFNIKIDKNTDNPTARCLAAVYPEWKNMREKHNKGLISDIDYIEWKLTYTVVL